MDVIYAYYLNFMSSLGIKPFFYEIFFAIIPFVIIAAFLILTVLFLVLAERRVLALYTQRKGPNRVGWQGCLQTLCDAFKLLFKEDKRPRCADKILFFAAPLIVFIPVMTAYATLHYSPYFDLLKSHVGVLLYIALLGVPLIGFILAGYASNNKYSLLGAIRACAQAISYELPLVMSALSVAILAGSLNLAEIINAQSGKFGLFEWFFIPSLIGFVIFLICAVAELNRVPFDLPEAESELVSGYSTEYSGMKFAFFFLAEYALLFLTSVFMVILFFGGYTSPFGVYISKLIRLPEAFIYIEQIIWLFLKTYLLIFFIMLTRAALMRLRCDKLMNFAWKVLLPLSILNVFIVSFIRYIRGFS